jgi:16S rRNA (uracil1498-N3)-methyltransferase
MAGGTTKTRLYVDAPLAAGASVALAPEQAHQLRNVLRLGRGEAVALFNGRDGEWRAELVELTKKGGTAQATERLREQTAEPDIWLVFAPIKRGRVDWLVEKAVELGAARLLPVITAHTQVERVRLERLQAHAREAAEQCERLAMPPVAEPVTFEALLAGWPQDRLLLYGDETGGGAPLTDVLAGLGAADRAAPWAVLVGPEGGFAGRELDALRNLQFARGVGLGPRVLRADTAGLALLACWQAWLGDWHARPAFRGHG